MFSANPKEPTVDEGDCGAVVGSTTRIAGSIDGDENLRVHGRVEGTVRLSATLYVEQGGELVADVEVKVAVIAGMVRGNIKATEFVRLAETGRMVGDILAPRFILDDGAAIRGRVDMGEFETAQPAGQRDGNRERGP